MDEDIRTENCLSDFDFIYRMFDAAGNPIGFPPDGVDWNVCFYTPHSNRVFIASCIDGVCTNCFNDNGQIHVVAKNHGLAPGRILSTPTILNPNDIYPDGIQRIVSGAPVNIELVTGAGDMSPVPPVADVTLPVMTVRSDEPLPMGFYRERSKNKHPSPDTMLFCRKRNCFVRVDTDGNVAVVDPADGPYNVYTKYPGWGVETPSGRVIANNGRRYVCGQTVYRFTGIELVNTAIEQNPNRQLVCRIPGPHAHPGIAYLDRGELNLLPTPESGEVCLKGMYFQRADGTLVPLIKLQDRSTDNKLIRIRRDDEIVEIVNQPTSTQLPRAALSLTDEGLPKSFATAPRNSFIGVRYDSYGRKIFYRFKADFPRKEHRIDFDVVQKNIKVARYGEKGMVIRMVMDGLFPNEGDFTRYKFCDLKMEVWDRNKHGSRGRRVGSDGKMWARDYKYQWRWRKKISRGGDPIIHVNRYNCLIRIKIKVGNCYTPWHYYHVASNVKSPQYGESVWVRVRKAKPIKMAWNSKSFES